jgi:molecular chaperone DnaK
VSRNLEELENQLENEGVTADGKLKIQDSLRKELLKLDNAEKVAEWPKVEQALKDAFYEFEDLIEKIKVNSDDEDLNIDKIKGHIQEYKKNIEQIIQQKDLKAAKTPVKKRAAKKKPIVKNKPVTKKK